MTTRLALQGIHSLKAKRSIVKSVVERLRNRFNVSVSVVGDHDSKASALLGIAVISNETTFVNQQLDTVLDFMRRDGRFYVGQTDRETFNA